MKSSDIIITVTIDENQVPEKLEWQASDSGVEGKKESSAMLLSFWDPQNRSTLRIDLWTQNMLIDDMKRFFFENMMTLAETYQRATNDQEWPAEMRKFAKEFGTKTGVLKGS